MSYDNIRQQDREVYDAMMRELRRQQDHIELIASENFVSPAVMEAMGSHLTNKYAEGYPGARYYGLRICGRDRKPGHRPGQGAVRR